ncbi:MAG: hypothetical protein HY294_15805 [Candidatus Rokubacteria bacterium]|nr:hypothetical protein [Candidatus Rokubacteria bacterium]
MNRTARWIAAGPLLATLALAAPVVAQDRVAEVKTWDGRTWRLSQPTFEVFYTIMAPGAPALDGGGPAAPSGGGPMIIPQTMGAQRGFGTLQAEAQALERRGVDSTQGRRARNTLTVSRAGVETQVPVERIASLVLSRAPVTINRLPPHVARAHFRYAARIVLIDGAVVDADAVSLGTTILRGTAAEGRVDVPWEAIESVRFTR